MTPALAAACRQSVHVVRADGHVIHGGEAVLFVLDRLGWHNASTFLRAPPLRPLVERGYAWVAVHRPLVSRILRITWEAA